MKGFPALFSRPAGCVSQPQPSILICCAHLNICKQFLSYTFLGHVAQLFAYSRRKGALGRGRLVIPLKSILLPSAFSW